MSDYTRVLKGLRHCINLDGLEPNDTRIRCHGCPYFTEPTRCGGILMRDSAAAIEALQAVLKEADKKQAYQHDCICELTAENEELKAEVDALKHDIERYVQMNTELLNDRPELEEIGGKWVWKEPKRGEIVRCKECIHFTQGGWCDREFDWFPVDENDFCSMAEKMEVQDGK